MADTIINESDKNTGLVVEVKGDNLKNSTAAKKAVEEQFLISQGSVVQLKTQLADIQSQLLALINNYNPAKLSSSLDKIDYDKAAFPNVPYYVEVLLNNAWPTDKPIKPQLDDIGPIDWSVTEPPTPKALETFFNHIPSSYSSELRAQLTLNMLNDLKNGGNGIPEHVYAALINKERDTRLRQQDEALREAMKAAGGRGFGITEEDGRYSSILSEMYRAQVHADQNAHNNIVALDYEYTVRAKEFSHNLSTELERLFSSDFNLSEGRRLEVSRLEYQLTLEGNKQAIELYIAQWQGIVSKTERLIAHIDGVSALNKNKTDIYTAQWDGYSANVAGVAAENQAKLQQRSLQLQNKQLEVGLTATQRQENRADAEFDLKQELAELNAELQEFGINLDGYKSGADLTASVLGTISKVLGQLTASTLATTGSTATMSFRGGESVSHSKSWAANLSESYPDQSEV